MLGDVYLLTAESGGQLAIPNLTIVIDQEGLSVLAPDGRIAATLTWSELLVLRTSGRLSAPGGEDAVLLLVASAQRTHQFAVPTSDPFELETTISDITGLPGPEPAPRSRRRR
jgi:hypothetical protein